MLGKPLPLCLSSSSTTQKAPEILTHLHLIDTYYPLLGQSPLLDDLLVRLRQKIMLEVKTMQELMSVMGVLEMICR